MPSKYVMKMIANAKKFGGLAIQKTISVKCKDKKKQIDVPELEQIYEGLVNEFEESGETVKILVRAQNIDKIYTFKGFDDDGLNIESFEDYLQGKVRDTTKFEKFSELQFTILQKVKPKKKK